MVSEETKNSMIKAAEKSFEVLAQTLKSTSGLLTSLTFEIRVLECELTSPFADHSNSWIARLAAEMPYESGDSK